jgi:cytidine deaminase
MRPRRIRIGASPSVSARIETILSGLSEQDRALIRSAQQAIEHLYRPHRHEVGAALRTRNGRVFTAINLDTRMRRASVCAEAVAMGMALSAGETEIEAVVAVRDGKVVAPCGICREMLSDYAHNASIIVPGPDGPEPHSVDSLLPRRYNKQGEP